MAWRPAASSAVILRRHSASPGAKAVISFVPCDFFFLQPGESLHRTVVLTVDAVVETADSTARRRRERPWKEATFATSACRVGVEVWYSSSRGCDEFEEALAGFAVDENGVGKDAVFNRVAGANAFARRGLRPGGFLRVGAVGGQAFVGDLHTIESMHERQGSGV